ncbi:hypothetical protein L596_023184 [Steinernema carpocapsae]|uniref:Uncharacterized protein n=1 Tax=Steinernema carpocapsae TaxID=34508 RepID=A0A4U5MCY1_STECR|nr:hypothetical protein L596_023184 [Steinernema carpocapsae]
MGSFKIPSIYSFYKWAVEPEVILLFEAFVLYIAVMRIHLHGNHVDLCVAWIMCFCMLFSGAKLFYTANQRHFDNLIDDFGMFSNSYSK